MHDFQRDLHPIIDEIFLPLIVINFDENALLEIREATGFYIQRLRKILKPETETMNHAKMHAWNTFSFIIEDYGEFKPKMATSDPTHWRLNHAMYLIAKYFDCPDIPIEVMIAIEEREETYKETFEVIDREFYAHLVKNNN